MPIGNRVFEKRVVPDYALVQAFRMIPTANIGDAMCRLYSMNTRIRLISNPPTQTMAGVALTVNARSGDNLFIHHAVDMAGKGDIIVTANGEEFQRSLAGELLVNHAISRGVEGFVFDGAIRDVDAIAQMTIPIYATGTTPGGPYKEGPGEINVPISCGGIAVLPGDIIVGDRDGVIVIRAQDAEEVLEAAQILAKADSQKVALAKAGQANREWITKTLKEKQTTFHANMF